MDQFQHPRDWITPQWHPDHGDPVPELEHLRAFALQVLSTYHDAAVVLESPEPGLMDVRVRLAGGLTAEVYSVRSKGTARHRRLALFFDPDTAGEDEVYADNVEDSLKFFKEKSGAGPHAATPTTSEAREMGNQAKGEKGPRAVRG